MKFNPDNAQEGVFFVNSDGYETNAKAFATRTLGKWVFHIPTALASGNDTLDVRRATTQANTIRKGVLPELLTVASGCC